MTAESSSRVCGADLNLTVREILVRGWKSQPWTMNLHRSGETEDKSPEVEGKDRTWGAL